MTRRDRGGKRSRETTMWRAARGALLLCGLGVLAGGFGWSGMSILAPVDAPPALSVASLSGDQTPRCLGVRARESLDRESCVQRAYWELVEGWAEIDDVLRRVRACDDATPEQVAALARLGELQAEDERARRAFGHAPTAGAESADAGTEGAPPPPGPAAVARLRQAGIDPLGLKLNEPEVLQRVARLKALRRDVREVFGKTTAGALERLVIAGPGRSDAIALRLGSTVVVTHPEPARSGDQALLLSREEYTDLVRERLMLLEEARAAYLSAAGEAHRHRGSIRGFVGSLPFHEEGEPLAGLASARAAVELERMRQVIGSLRRELGADPGLMAIASDRVDSALALSEGCEATAARRASRVRTGAGVVTGLAGAAMVVVAAGATGTLIGGVTIAAALHAAGGSYLGYRSELAGHTPDESAARDLRPPVDAEAEPFRRHARAGSHTRGDDGPGAGEWLEESGEGEWRELDGEGGEGDRLEKAEGHTELERRESTFAAELPPPLELDAIELPPMLEALRSGTLPRLTLTEAQRRLDEFLALDSRERPAAARDLRSASRAALIEEARAALALWVERRELTEGFTDFFLRAEVEDLPRNRREPALVEAADRWMRDRGVYRQARDVDALRTRIAERLVVHCRGGAARGDLILQACSDPTALSIVVVGAIRDAEITIPAAHVLGVQAIGPDFHPVLFHPARREVVSMLTGEVTQGVAAPLYHPASFFYGFLLENGERPSVDVEAHLLIAPADPGLAAMAPACEEPRSRNVFTRLTDWVRSVFGRQMPSRRGAACGGDGVPGRSERDAGRSADAGAESGGGGGGVQVTLTRPGLQIPRGGSGAPGGGRAGGGGGGSQGGSTAGQAGRAGGEGESGGATAGGSSGDQTAGSGRSGGERSAGAGDGEGGGSGGQGGAGDGTGGGTERKGSEGSGGANGASSGSGSGVAGGDAEGGRYIPGSSVDLVAVGRDAESLARTAREEGALRVRGWRLRENHSFTPPSARVVYADNEHARARFRPEDRFITMSPSLVEEQRRMFEADSFAIFPATTDCGSPGLPPRRVFRRATDGGGDARYVFCDQDESMVAFRDRADATAYARLNAPDRPLLLARFASERIQRFEDSEEIRAIHAFLADPEVIRTMRVADLDSLVNAAVELLWFQETLEATLFLSMHELEGSPLRRYYYDLNRQVAQSPFLVELVEAVHRFNLRLASDPLRSLAWVGALPPEHRTRFFSLYYTLGGPMYWPTRWEALHLRYAVGGEGSPIAPLRRDEPSPDFLQVTSDPTRVRIDWSARRPENRPSVHDRVLREGVQRTQRVVPTATDAKEFERQEMVRRLRAGTQGLGRAGEGDGLGPERGRRPLQMVRIRMAPETGDPDRMRMPEHNTTRPGGTEGERRVQELSASRQEPVLWLEPRTFTDAILSAWDPPREHPARASRVPPALRFSPRLRAIFLEQPDEDHVYEARLANAMSVLATGGWLGFEEVRRAFGGDFQGVRAHDLGRYAAEYARNAAIVDQAQVRGPNYFTRSSIPLPADLVSRVRHGFSRHGTGNFDLRPVSPPDAVPLPVADGGGDGDERLAARAELLRALELIAAEARRGEGRRAGGS